MFAAGEACDEFRRELSRSPCRMVDTDHVDLSTGGILASFFIGTVGFAFFIYGKKQLRFPQLIGGIVLMGFPYFVGGAAAMLAIGAAVIGAIWIAVRAGL
jgi:hypothetical protein